MAISTGAALLGSAVIGGLGARSAAKSQAASADRNAQLAYEQSLPWSTKGIFGEATFDEDTRQATIGLSPELQKLYEDRLARAAGITQQIGAYDPEAYRKEFLAEQRALAAPEEERQRLATENRLRRMGLLTATAGASQVRGLEEALQMKDLARVAEARSAAQQQQTFLRGLESQDIGTALQLGALPMDYASMGRGIGQGLSGAAQAGASMRQTAAANLADTTAAFWGSLGGSLGNYASGGQLYNNQLFGGGYSTFPTVYGQGAMPLGAGVSGGSYSYRPSPY